MIKDYTREGSPSRGTFNEKKFKELFSLKKRHTLAAERLNQTHDSIEKIGHHHTQKSRDDAPLASLRTFVVLNRATMSDSPLKVRLEQSPLKRRDPLSGTSARQSEHINEDATHEEESSVNSRIDDQSTRAFIQLQTTAEDVDKTNSDSHPEQSYQVDNVLESDDAVNGIKAAFVDEALLDAVEVQSDRSEQEASEESEDGIDGLLGNAGRSTTMKNAREKTFNLIEVQPENETSHDWFRGESGLFKFVFERLASIKSDGHDVDSVLVQACHARLCERTSQNSNFIQMRDMMMPRAKKRWPKHDLNAKNTFVKQLEGRRVREVNFLEKTLENVRKEAMAMEVDKTQEIPASFDVLRLSLNITLKDEELDIETDEQQKDGVSRASTKNFDFFTNIEDFIQRRQTSKAQQKILIIFNLIAVNYCEVKNEEKRMAHAQYISSSVIKLAKSLQREQLAGKRREGGLRNSLATIRPSVNQSLTASSLEIAELLQGRGFTKQKVAEPFKKLESVDEIEENLSCEEESVDLNVGITPVGQQRTLVNKRLSGALPNRERPTTARLRSKRDAGAQTDPLTELDIFNQVLKVISQRHESVMQGINLDDEQVGECLEMFKEQMLALLEHILNMGLNRQPTIMSGASGDESDRGKKGGYWQGLMRRKTLGYNELRDDFSINDVSEGSCLESTYSENEFAQGSLDQEEVIEEEDDEESRFTITCDGSSSSDEDEEDPDDYWADKLARGSKSREQAGSRLSRRSKASNSRRNSRADNKSKLTVHTLDTDHEAILEVIEETTPIPREQPKAGSGDAPDVLSCNEPKISPCIVLQAVDDEIESSTRGPDTGASPSAQKTNGILSTSQESNKQQPAVDVVARNKATQAHGGRYLSQVSPDKMSKFLKDACERAPVVPYNTEHQLNGSARKTGMLRNPSSASKKFAREYMDMLTQDWQTPIKDNSLAARGIASMRNYKPVASPGITNLNASPSFYGNQVFGTTNRNAIKNMLKGTISSGSKFVGMQSQRGNKQMRLFQKAPSPLKKFTSQKDIRFDLHLGVERHALRLDLKMQMLQSSATALNQFGADSPNQVDRMGTTRSPVSQYDSLSNQRVSAATLNEHRARTAGVGGRRGPTENDQRIIQINIEGDNSNCISKDLVRVAGPARGPQVRNWVIPEAQSQLERSGNMMTGRLSEANNGIQTLQPFYDTSSSQQFATIPWQDFSYEREQYIIDATETLAAKINVYKMGSSQWSNQALVLHNDDSLNYEHQVAAFLHCQHQVFFIDPPGAGKSTGSKLPQESARVFDKPGLAQLVHLVMDHFSIKQPVIAGYDSGASTALKMALKDPTLFKSIIIFHPNYREDVIDELKQLQVPVLVQHVRQDLQHSWLIWQPLAEKIPNVKICLLEASGVGAMHSENTWQGLSDQITTSIVNFLGASDDSQLNSSDADKLNTSTNLPQGSASKVAKYQRDQAQSSQMRLSSAAPPGLNASDINDSESGGNEALHKLNTTRGSFASPKSNRSSFIRQPTDVASIEEAKRLMQAELKRFAGAPRPSVTVTSPRPQPKKEEPTVVSQAEQKARAERLYQGHSAAGVLNRRSPRAAPTEEPKKQLNKRSLKVNTSKDFDPAPSPPDGDYKKPQKSKKRTSGNQFKLMNLLKQTEQEMSPLKPSVDPNLALDKKQSDKGGEKKHGVKRGRMQREDRQAQEVHDKQKQEQIVINKEQAIKAVVKKQKDLTNKVVDDLDELDVNSHPALKNLSVEHKITPYVWGNNMKGMLGITDLQASKSKVHNIKEPTKFPQQLIVIKQGHQHNLGIGPRGQLYSWGQNRYGQLGRLRRRENANQRDDEEGADAKNNLESKKRQRHQPHPDDFREIDLVAGELHKVKVRDICCGWDHSLATTMSGLLFAWGLNVHGELGIGNYNDYDTPQHVDALQHYNIVEMSAGKHHTGAVTECGKLFIWGYNPDGRLLKRREFYKKNGQARSYFLPQEVCIQNRGVEKRIKAVSCGQDHTLVIDIDGIVYSGGNSANGQLGTHPGFYVLDDDTKAPYVTVDRFSPERGLQAVAVAAGRDFSMALASNGKVYTCGLNELGRLGLGKDFENYKKINEFTAIPHFVHNAITITDIAAGGRHCLAVSAGNTRASVHAQEYRPNLYVWGSNFLHQLGQGYSANEDLDEPRRLQINMFGKVGIRSIAAGYGTSACVQSELKQVIFS